MNNTVYECDALTITQTAENQYRAINEWTDIEMKVDLIDEYRTSIESVHCKRRGKDGKFRKASADMRDHCERWLLYMLEEYGIIRKRKVIGG